MQVKNNIRMQMWWLFFSFLCMSITLFSMDSDVFEPVPLNDQETETIDALKFQLRSSFEKKETPLHWKTATKSDIYELISRKLADVDAQDSQGNTPLHKAIEYGDIEKVLLFLDEYKANVLL